jgi:4-hydroxythreonine-4-phosphate dehydrogenase
MKPTIAITAGDINGVGYEIIVKCIADAHICEICRPIVYGNAKVAKQHIQTMDEQYHNIQWNIINDAKQAKDGRLNLITCYNDDTPVQLGVSTAEAGQASFKSLQRACQDLKQGLVHAIVTAPINKDNIQSDKFQYSGHTEYLTKLFGQGKDSLMMMLSGSSMSRVRYLLMLPWLTFRPFFFSVFAREFWLMLCLRIYFFRFSTILRLYSLLISLGLRS